MRLTKLRLLFACFLLAALNGFSQEFNSFDVRYQNNLKGDLTFIANNIVNRDEGGDSPEDPYNRTGRRSTYNDWFNQQYIDVDSDPSTFSSSSATFTYEQADCSLIRYAGLYWSATYPSEQAGQPVGTNRQNDFNQVKFRVPGGAYVDITADEVLFDGFTHPWASVQQNSPYACYADVTGIVSALANPEGEYTVANIRSVTGSLSPGGGAAGGWTLVIVYENPTLTGKLITTFDGFARVRSQNPTVDINYNGFTTIPVGPVRANIGVAALEGDNRITGDGMAIRAASNPGFTVISDPANPGNNFFNSNISQDGAIVTARNPNSVNTLGYDTDMFLLNNPLNGVLPNDETAATFRFTSNGDQYYPFFNSFNVEIIEPNIVLEKRVEDIGGNDITGLGVNLGQILDYVLSFENNGNDDATNYTIRDILPINVTLDETNLTLPPGVTYSYNPGTREVVFNVPDNLVEEGDPISEIRMRVQVAENCFDFIDACTDIIQNVAFSTYQGVINDNQITDDPSVSDFDTCGFVTPGATNFLLDDLENCDFYRTVELCGNDVVLDAGDNFDSYVWYRDNNADGLIDAGDTVITDGDPDNDPSTFLVTEVGQYIVDKIVADPCKGFEEIIEVVLPGQTQTNPIIDLINDTSNTVEGEVVTCANDGDLLPKIFLCGLNDTELIEINIPDATSIVWEQLDEASCTDSGDDCANKNSACTWNQVDTGNDFLASDAGEYRVVVNYQNGCFTRFYFNIFKNPLDPQYNATDIICATPGNITVTNMPVDYEYQLVDASNGAILVPYSDGNGPSFDISTNGAYTVEMRQIGVVDGCVFYLENIGILNRDFQVDIAPLDAACSGLGEIAISVLDVEPQYYYEISQGGSVVDTFGPSTDNNYTFENLNAGIYDVQVTTDDGCLYNEQVEILDISDLELEARVSQHITCREGNILMSSSGGQTPHTYAIWEFIDEGGITQLSYPDPTAIPPSEFQSSQIFDILDPGTYTFVVVDRNNCFAISNPVDIEFEPAADFDPTTVIDALCFGEATGGIQFNLIDNNGYQLTFYLFDATTFDEDNYDYANALATNTSGFFPGIPAGDYAIVINQRKGSASCDYFEYQTVSGPANALAGDAALTQTYTCLQDGIIQAQNVTGGTAPYEYSIDGIAFGASDTFTGLTAGTYTVTVRDAAGCTVQAAPITIDPLNLPDDLDFTTTAITCLVPGSDVTVTVPNGTAPFNVEIIAPAAIPADATAGNTATFNGLVPDTYTFRVTDTNGCTYQENLTINPITPIGVTGQQISPVSCFGGTDGEALYNVSGFATSYDYSVAGPASFSGIGEVNPSISLSGLPAGTYDITVTDTDTDCTDTASVTIDAPAAALALSLNATQPTCTADGNITLTASDGWGGYTYTLTLPDASSQSNSNGIFTGLALDGTYLAEVSDANGCIQTTSVDLNAAIPPVLDLAANDICYDDATGLTLTASITSGGDGNYQYRLNGGAYGPSNVFSGLGPGTYTVEVIDGNNCTDTASITVDPELTLTATADPITACATDTEVFITAAGGDGNFVYAVVSDGVSPTPGDFGASATITVTGAGDYDVYVRDKNGGVDFCEVFTDLTITQDAPLALTPAITDVLCFGESTGSISIAIAGGNAPYLYSIDDGTTYQTGSDFVNLPAGTYNLRVQDAEGCEVTDVVTINEPAALVAEAAITQTYTCLQLGEITIGGITPTSGGSGSYQYRLNGGAWSAPTPIGIVYPDLTDGTYTVEVRDAAATGCVLSLPPLVIDPLPTEPLLSTSITYNCDGTGDITVLPSDPAYTYSLDAGPFQASNVFTGIAPGNYTVTVNYGSDCTVDTAVVVEAGLAFDAAVLSQTDLLCNGDNSGEIVFEVDNFDLVNGFEYQVNGGGFSAPQTSSPITVSGLAAGPYTIEVRDVLDPSCIITLNTTLSEPAALEASATITEEVSCTNTGATLTASAIGGTPNYLYQLEDDLGAVITAYQASNVFTAVPAGNYIVRVQDANGCEDPIDVVITIAPPETLTFTAAPTACYSGNNDAEILVTVTDGNGGYLFNIDGGPWMTPSPVTATTYTFGNLVPGTYDINVRDAYGCIGTPVSVTINPQLLASAVLTADLTCLAPASIDVNATGGSGTYSYEWSDDAGATWDNTGFVGNTFSTNTDGTYIFRVTDTTSPTACTDITDPVVVSPAQTPVITSITPTDILCNGDLTGMLDVVIDTSVGLGPFTVDVVNTTTATVYGTQTTGLPAGDYEVTVTDAKGCVSVPFPVTISQPDAIAYSINLQSITCDPMLGGTQPGSITVENLTGGTAEYTYYLTGNNGYSDSYATVSGGEDYTFTILEFGIYEVDVVDANGCSVRTTNIIASPPDDLDIDVSTATASCAAGGTAIVTVSSLVGSGNYEFAILETYTVPYSSSYQPADVVGGDTATFTALIPGITYTFVVHDLTTNCYYFETAAAPIDSPSNMTVSNLVARNISCTGAADGSVTFDIDTFDAAATAVDYEVFDFQSNDPLTPVVSGTIPVNPPAGPVTLADIGPLDQGVYYVLLTEVGGPFAGCSIATPEFTITQSTNLLQVTADSPQNDNCNPNAGVITATAQFGTAPYEFQYLLSTDPAPTAADPGWTSSTTANVEAGDYIVYVKDANDCIQSDPVTVILDPRPEISIAVVDECAPEGTFEVLVTLTSPGIAPYQISVNGGAWQNITFDGLNQYTVTGLSSGLGQSIAVQGLYGCADTDPFDIQPPLQFNASLTTLLDCEPAPNNNAEITIEVTAGSGNYDYEISGPVSQARAPLPSPTHVWDLASAPGTYTVTIYDTGTVIPNCLGTIDVEVPPAILPQFTEIHQDVSCFGGTDGFIQLFQTDTGINPLTYTISPVAGTFNPATDTFEGLPAGTYEITATGTNSCTAVISNIIIDEPAPVVVPAPVVTPFGCPSGNNPDPASILVDASGITGGSGTYTVYEFINDQGTVATGDDVVVQSGTNPLYTETNTAGGSYIINVYDSNGCVGSTTAIIPEYDALIDLTAAITNPLSCVPGADGEITLTATSTTGNTALFEYSIDNGATWVASHVFGGLTAGTYTFLLRHLDTGCVLSVVETLTDPNTFDIAVDVLSNVVCHGTQTGEVTFELVDATFVGGFDWTIYDTNGTPGNTADDVLVDFGTSATNGPTASIPLFEGEYLVEMTQTGAPQCTQTEFFNIAGPPAPLSASVLVTPITCLEMGSIEIYDAQGGWGTYEYYVGNVPPAGPGDYLASTLFDNLPAGTYQAWVIDAQGCSELIQDNIILTDPAPITASLQVNQENCTNLEGEIEVVGVAGGQGSNYTYQLILNGTDFRAPQTSRVFSGLGGGSYEVRITDQWGCTVTIGPEVLYDEMTSVGTVIKPLDCTASPDGEITIVTQGGSGNFDYTVTFPDGTTTVSNPTGVFTGLDQAGTYVFVVSDLDTTPNCTETVSVELVAPTPVTLDPATVVDVSCFGGSDGSILVNLTPSAPGVNDNPPYTYELFLGAASIAGPQSDPLFTGLTQGNYTVEVVSGRACVTTQNITVNEPAALTLSASATAFSCAPDNSVNSATVTAIAGGGTAPYLYSIDGINYQSSNSFEVVDDQTVQNLTVIVRDANGCETPAAITLEPLNVFSASVSQTAAITCLGPEEVLVSVIDDLNPANTYTFELLPVGNPDGAFISNPSPTEAIFELSVPGSYVFRITDNTTGCYVTTLPYDVAPYDLIEAIVTPVSPVTCFGDTDGALSLEVTGYTGAYDYEVFNASGTSTGMASSANTAGGPITINGLSGGNYYVQVTATGTPFCSEDSNIVTIVSPDMPLTAVVSEEANVTCTNDQGEILVSPSGGYAPYDIVLRNTTTPQTYTANGVNAQLFTGLSAGNFTIEVTDASGCVYTDAIILTEPLPIMADITATPMVLACYGDTNAEVRAINVVGGSGNYTYSLNYYDASGIAIEFSSGFQSSDVFTGLGAGIYSITVSDEWNCDVETVQVTISEPSEVTANLVQTVQMTCTGDAQLVLTAGGGTAPYEYSTDGIVYSPMSGGDTHTFTVTDGVYQYYVRDAQGCEANLSNQISIEPVPPLMVEVDESAAIINCTGEMTASLMAIATGGLGNYQFELYGDAALTNLLSGPQQDGTFAGLGVGSYWVRVTSQDCETVSGEIIVNEPVPLQIDREEFTDVTCSGEDDGTITVEVSGGTGEILYAISPNLNQFDDVNTFTDLEAGIYDVIAQDENGCFITFQFTISEPQPIQLAGTSMPEICAGSEDGSIDITINGGTAPYRTAFNSNLDTDFGPAQTTFTDLAAGTYVIFVRDAQDCEANIIVEVAPGVNLNAVVTPIYECTGAVPDNYLEVVLEDPSVSDQVMYALDSTDPSAMQLDADFSSLSPGPHFLAVSHANGCVQTIDFEIETFEPLTLVLEQQNINEITAIAEGGTPEYTFTFNGDDNGNDNTYYITETGTYLVEVMDQNGCVAQAEIFMEFIDIEIPNYFTPDGDGQNDFWMPDNTEGFPEILIKIYDRYGRVVANLAYGMQGWDGTYDGRELPTGDYWYTLKLNGERDQREFVGHFTLYR